MTKTVKSSASWPADKIERWPIERLIPYARNARKHTPAQVAQIAASIKEWGWTVPVLADEDGGLIAGHGRVLAARKLELTEVPVMTAHGWTESQKRAYIIADNKLTLNASWDEDMLALEFDELKYADFDLELTGFMQDEIDALNTDGRGLGDGGDAPAQNVAESWAVIVECKDEADQVELIERLQAEGRNVRGSIG
jgi:ParB-like chromosome segregation protein Spo0J